MHVQQYVTVVHGIRWIGPLFIAQAVACAVVIVGLVFRAPVGSEHSSAS